MTNRAKLQHLRLPGRAVLLLALMFACGPGIRGAFALPVEAEHPVYAFLRRLEMRGLVKPTFPGTMPRPKAEIDRMLKEALSHSHDLRPYEITRILAIQEELGLKESGKGFPAPVAYRDSNAELRAGIEYFTGGYYEDSLPRPRAFAFGSLNATVEGSYKQRLQFSSTAGVGMERSRAPRFTENYDPAEGLPYNTSRAGKGVAGTPQKVSTMDAFRTVVGYEEPALRLELGTDWNQWGPGIWQHAFFSRHPWFWVQDSLPAEIDTSFFPGTPYPGRYRRGYRYPGEAAPMTQMRAAFRLGRLEYTKVVAQRTGIWTDTPAYVVAHRLELRPWDCLGLGVEEMVALSGRSLDWTYIIPLIPLKYGEHELGDRDNTAIGFDAEWLLSGYGRLYGEFFLDDFSGFDVNFWGNKFAFTVGGEAVNLPLWESVLRAEYSRVEPWVFTHTRANDQLQHYGALLGSSLPPNSHALHLAWEHPVLPALDLTCEYMFMQRGLDTRGSSPFDLHSPADGTQKRFLSGTVESRHVIGLEAKYRWRRFVELRSEVGYMAVENWKSLPGKKLATPTASGELFLRY